jgi:hypothetical protein
MYKLIGILILLTQSVSADEYVDAIYLLIRMYPFPPR